MPNKSAKPSVVGNPRRGGRVLRSSHRAQRLGDIVVSPGCYTAQEGDATGWIHTTPKIEAKELVSGGTTTSSFGNAELCAHGLVLSGNPERACQEFKKTTLDKANNNLNFVQEPGVCPVPAVVTYTGESAPACP